MTTNSPIIDRIETHRHELGLPPGTPSPGAWIPTCGNRGQNHVAGIIGAVFVVRSDGETRSSLPLPLRVGEVYVGLTHTGDCFQDYGKLEMVDGKVRLCLGGNRICGYGLPGAEKMFDLPKTQMAMLVDGLSL